MRFKTFGKLENYRTSDQRLVRKFALFKKYVDNQTVWLEWYYSLQNYKGGFEDEWNESKRYLHDDKEIPELLKKVECYKVSYGILNQWYWLIIYACIWYFFDYLFSIPK